MCLTTITGFKPVLISESPVYSLESAENHSAPVLMNTAAGSNSGPALWGERGLATEPVANHRTNSTLIKKWLRVYNVGVFVSGVPSLKI